MQNQAKGHMSLKAKTVKETNDLMSEVLNGMLANLKDDMVHGPDSLNYELHASEHNGTEFLTEAEHLQLLVNHYIKQRKRSVGIEENPELWVQQAHLKGMIMRAREEVYVLDVNRTGNTRVQVYAY